MAQAIKVMNSLNAHNVLRLKTCVTIAKEINLNELKKTIFSYLTCQSLVTYTFQFPTYNINLLKVTLIILNVSAKYNSHSVECLDVMKDNRLTLLAAGYEAKGFVYS